MVFVKAKHQAKCMVKPCVIDIGLLPNIPSAFNVNVKEKVVNAVWERFDKDP